LAVKPRSATPSSRVFAGSEERRQDAGLTRDQVTLPPPPPVPVTAFQRGWIALRDAHYAEAIAAFDQATEPAVAEDAAYWAAIASARAGDFAAAARRMTAFVAKFPGSTRISDARTMLVRLAP
jgi:TolA-binding protein